MTVRAVVIITWIQAMVGRQALGCLHTQGACEAQKVSYRDAVRLHIAKILQYSPFHAECHVCSADSLPLCCLSCDFIGCPRHSSHEHSLGCCLGSDLEGAVWCFECKDAVIDAEFEQIRDAEIHKAMHAPGPRNALQKHQIKEVSSNAHAGLKGLVNLGATCYISVVLQSLVHNPLVRAFFLGGGHQQELCSRSSCLVCAVDRLYTDFFGSVSVSGYGITDLLIALAGKQPVMGAGSTEQDAHEFYLMLLSEFHTVFNSAKSSAANRLPGQLHTSKMVTDEPCGCVTHRNFAGSIESTLKCNCGKDTRRREPIVDLGLDLGNATSTSLDASLKRFVTPETIANYTCDNCGKQNTTTKQQKLADLPAVLLIQLKRFKHVGGTKGSIKVETPVYFPLQIDVAPYTSSENLNQRSLVYELYGVICHTGTLDTGHYTCMMKHSSGQWYNFDDVAVTPVDVKTVTQAKRAYLLFYIVKWTV